MRSGLVMVYAVAEDTSGAGNGAACVLAMAAVAMGLGAGLLAGM